MSTYNAMQVRIANEASASGLADEIKLEIQSAIEFYESETFAFNQGTLSFSTVAGQTEYGASDHADIPNIKKIHAASAGQTGWSSPITSCTYEEIFDALETTGNTFPEWYAYYDSTLYIAPPTASGYTVRLAYIKVLSTLSAGPDTNAWMTDAEQLIRTRARKMLFINYLHQYEDADRLEPIEARMFADLKAEVMQLSYDAPAKLSELARVSNHGSFNIYKGGY